MCAYAIMCVAFARIVLTYINVKIHPAVESRPLIQVALHVPYLASYCDITYFETLHLMYPNIYCTSATESRSQCDDVMVHVLLE